MPLIPAENIPTHDGVPQCLVLLSDRCKDHEHHDNAVMVLPLTPEQVTEARASLRAQVEAIATLTGNEVPEHIIEALDGLDDEDDLPAGTAVADFQICWN